MNSGEYIAVVLVLCGIVIFVLADKLIAARRTAERQKVIINHQIADMKRMIAELESWEKCLHLILRTRRRKFSRSSTKRFCVRKAKDGIGKSGGLKN